MRGVGGVCEMYMCLARGGVGCMVGERIWFGLYQSCRNKGCVGRVYVFGLRSCVCCKGGVGAWLGPVSGRVG